MTPNIILTQREQGFSNGPPVEIRKWPRTLHRYTLIFAMFHTEIFIVDVYVIFLRDIGQLIVFPWRITVL